MRNTLFAPVMFLVAAMIPAVALQDTPSPPYDDVPSGQQKPSKSDGDGSVRDTGAGRPAHWSDHLVIGYGVVATFLTLARWEHGAVADYLEECLLRLPNDHLQLRWEDHVSECCEQQAIRDERCRYWWQMSIQSAKRKLEEANNDPPSAGGDARREVRGGPMAFQLPKLDVLGDLGRALKMAFRQPPGAGGISGTPSTAPRGVFRMGR